MARFKPVNQKDYRKALVWIVGILKKHKIKYNILGGLAARAYGSKRRLVDIDLSMKNSDFKKLLPDIKDHIVEAPHYSISKNWKCYFMEFKYKGITIEVGGDKGCKMFNSKTKKWENMKDGLTKPTIKKVLGLNLPIIPKKNLISYKTKLKRKVDLIDLKYIK